MLNSFIQEDLTKIMQPFSFQVSLKVGLDHLLKFLLEKQAG